MKRKKYYKTVYLLSSKSVIHTNNVQIHSDILIAHVFCNLIIWIYKCVCPFGMIYVTPNAKLIIKKIAPFEYKPSHSGRRKYKRMFVENMRTIY